MEQILLTDEEIQHARLDAYYTKQCDWENQPTKPQVEYDSELRQEEDFCLVKRQITKLVEWLREVGGEDNIFNPEMYEFPIEDWQALLKEIE